MPIRFQRLDDLDLVLRRHAGKDGDLADAACQVLLGDGVQLRPGHDVAFQSQFARHGRSSAPVIAGNHLDLYPRGATQLDRFCSLGPWRIHEAREPQKRPFPGPPPKIARWIELRGRDRTRGHRQHP